MELGLHSSRVYQIATSTKQAWDILQTEYEQTINVREFRVQLLTTKFENMKIEGGKCISQYHGRVYTIANEAFCT